MPQRLTLQFLTPPMAGQQIVLTGPEHTVGRQRGLAVTIPATSVSSQHARLFLEGERWGVVDRGSTNGTFLNEVRLGSAPVMLSPAGGLLSFANVQCRFQYGSAFGDLSDAPETLAVTRSALNIPLNPPSPEVQRPTVRAPAPVGNGIPPVGAGFPAQTPRLPPPPVRMGADAIPITAPGMAPVVVPPPPKSPAAAAGAPAVSARSPLSSLAVPLTPPGRRAHTVQGLALEPTLESGLPRETADSLISLSGLDASLLGNPAPFDADAELDAASAVERTAWTRDALEDAAEEDHPTTSLHLDQMQEQLRDALRQVSSLKRENAAMREELLELRKHLEAEMPNRAPTAAEKAEGAGRGGGLQPELPSEVRSSGLMVLAAPFLDRVVAALSAVESTLGRDEARAGERSSVLDARLALADLRSLLDEAMSER